MDYSRFERLIVGVGATAIVATAALSLWPKPDVVELVAQLLLLSVLLGAVEWGRRGGTAAAVVSMVSYTLMRVPTVAVSGLTPDLLRLFAVRALTYGVLGIAGGEACRRIKYLLARSRDSEAIDAVSRIYTPSFVGRLLDTTIAAYGRYGVPFSLIVLAVDTKAAGRGSKADGLVRAIATQLRGELRLVDEVGHLPWGAYLVILPHTAAAGAAVAATRLRDVLHESLGIEDAAIETRVLSAAEDLQAIEALAEESEAAVVAQETMVQPSLAI